MFDGSSEGRLGVLVAAEVNLRTRRDADVELLRLALAWADLHGEESLPRPVDDVEVRRRRLAGVRMGGEGTPVVLSHCPAELGAVLEPTHTGAKHLIADALDLRDRLPRLWETVQDGAVATWQARRVVAATRALTREQVDGVVHGGDRSAGLVTVRGDPGRHGQTRQPGRRPAGEGGNPDPAICGGGAGERPSHPHVDRPRAEPGHPVVPGSGEPDRRSSRGRGRYRPSTWTR